MGCVREGLSEGRGGAVPVTMAFLDALAFTLGLALRIFDLFSVCAFAFRFRLPVPKPASEDDQGEGDTTPACVIQRAFQGDHFF